ncbi:hypothetical protein [uncultured Sphingomonas sp.]|uniref:hypothetical protein n=1 Tax=uncultured Sphingomonas sp. TaxID=158754 RepID=UPI0025EF21B8|nr:hypothetical protein [uncultured Sphingomonas sp.]
MTVRVAAAAPQLGGGGGLDVSAVRILAALVLSLAIAGAVILVLRRGGGRIDLSALRLPTRVVGARRIAPIETRRISAHADLCLVRCDGIDYLILSSAGQQQVLRETAVVAEPLP